MGLLILFKMKPITKGNKKLDPKALFGIWAAQPRDIETIRKAGWQRKFYS
jgi:hypothetical protein